MVNLLIKITKPALRCCQVIKKDSLLKINPYFKKKKIISDQHRLDLNSCSLKSQNQQCGVAKFLKKILSWKSIHFFGIWIRCGCCSRWFRQLSDENIAALPFCFVYSDDLRPVVFEVLFLFVLIIIVSSLINRTWLPCWESSSITLFFFSSSSSLSSSLLFCVIIIYSTVIKLISSSGGLIIISIDSSHNESLFFWFDSNAAPLLPVVWLTIRKCWRRNNEGSVGNGWKWLRF